MKDFPQQYAIYCDHYTTHRTVLQRRSQCPSARIIKEILLEIGFIEEMKTT